MRLCELAAQQAQVLLYNVLQPLPKRYLYSSRPCFILCCHCFFMMTGGPWLAWAWAKAAVMIGELSVRIVVPMDMKKLSNVSMVAQGSIGFPRAYPKVAAEPSMYWPRVLIMPLGPGPKRMMLVAPKMKPMTRPTARSIVSREYIFGSHSARRTAAHHATHLHCQAVSYYCTCASSHV